MSDRHHLPDPAVRIGRRKFWRKSSIRQYIAQVAGESPPAPLSDDEQLIGSVELRIWLGGVSDMFIYRHSRRSAIGSSPAVNPPPDQAA
jgi:hypothetical protein